jgi:hypothetical protein
MPDHTPVLSNVRRHAGIAGQFSVTADVAYPDEPVERIEFVGSVYGGPVVMRTPLGIETFVTNPGRFGDFGPEWVQRFFS